MAKEIEREKIPNSKFQIPKEKLARGQEVLAKGLGVIFTQIKNRIRAFLLALSFISVIPLPFSKEKFSSREISQAAAFFPLVGFIFGLILWGFSRILHRLYLPVQIRDLFLLFFLTFLSGGLHLDGLADTFDGLLGGKTRAEALKIMRQGNIGTFGIAAIVFVLLFKYSLLISLTGGLKIRALILVPMLSRWPMVYAAFIGKPARKGGLGGIFLNQPRIEKLKGLIPATVTIIILTLLFAGFEAIWLLLALFLFTAFSTLAFSKKIKGLTGDIFGAQVELSEVFLFLMILLLSLYKNP